MPKIARTRAGSACASISAMRMSSPGATTTAEAMRSWSISARMSATASSNGLRPCGAGSLPHQPARNGTSTLRRRRAKSASAARGRRQKP